MTPEEFSKYAHARMAKELDILTKKGHDYTQGSKDRYKNFNDLAKELELSSLAVMFIFFKKHLDSIKTFIKHGAVESEDIQDRIADARNYLLLMGAWISERPSKDVVYICKSCKYSTHVDYETCPACRQGTMVVNEST